MHQRHRVHIHVISFSLELEICNSSLSNRKEIFHHTVTTFFMSKHVHVEVTLVVAEKVEIAVHQSSANDGHVIFCSHHQYRYVVCTSRMKLSYKSSGLLAHFPECLPQTHPPPCLTFDLTAVTTFFFCFNKTHGRRTHFTRQGMSCIVRASIRQE